MHAPDDVDVEVSIQNLALSFSSLLLIICTDNNDDYTNTVYVLPLYRESLFIYLKTIGVQHIKSSEWIGSAPITEQMWCEIFQRL